MSKKNRPLISVIIPAYNAQQYLNEAVDSILNQSLPEWELILVDDGSTDNTEKIIQGYVKHDFRIKSLFQKRSGAFKARCTGYQNATAEYIYFLDADDKSKPDTLKYLYNALVAWPEAVAAYGIIEKINDTGDVFYQQQPIIKKTYPVKIFHKLLERNFLFSGGAVCIKKSFLSEMDIAPPQLTYGEDYFLWCLLASRGPFVFVNKGPLMEYRVHETNQSNLSLSLLVQKRIFMTECVLKHESIRKTMTGTARIHYQKIHEFYVYYDLIRPCLFERNYRLTGIFVWRCLLCAVGNFSVLKKVACHFANELIQLLKRY